jgi:hypothetical protein
MRARVARPRYNSFVGSAKLIAPRPWIAPLLLVVAVALVPWTVVLGWHLPAQHTSEHWDAAWVGFDTAIVCALAATGFGIVRRASWLQIPAAMAAALLLTDAWFDNLLAHGHTEQVTAGLEAVFGEIPLAIVCLWVALHAEHATAAVVALRRRS